MNKFSTNRTNILKAALTAALLFAPTASYSSSDHQAVLDEFSARFADVKNVGMIVSNNGGRYGLHFYGVNQPTNQMCDIFTKVDPSVQYVIVNHKRAGATIQLFEDCRK